jgi:hypothetical protein
MIHDIGEIIKARLIGLNFVDRLAGITQVVSYQEQTRDKNPIIQRMPAACDVESLNCGEDKSRLKDLVPDSKKRSVIFLEDVNGANFVGRTRNDLNFTANIRLVAWINQQKLGKNDCSVSGPIMAKIIGALQTTSPFNSAPYTRITISINRIVPKTPAIFQRYTFPLEEKQYLMWPFDYFALDLLVKFSMNENCQDEFIIGPEDECEIA